MPQTMTKFPERITLGRSGLQVGPLGMSGGYGAPKQALLRAFERGVNYWYHGSRRAPGMTEAIRELVAQGKRDELVIVLQSYSRSAWLLERMFTRGLKSLRIDHADVLLLGWFNKLPSPAVMDKVISLKERGLCRHIAISSHHRPSFVDYASDTRFDIMHLRYNAAHTGAERDVFPHVSGDGRPGFVAYTVTRWKDLLKPSKMPPGESPMRARDCYRFAMSQPHIDVSMTGPSNESHVDEALAALDEGPITDEENERFRRIGEHVHETSKKWLLG